jgi:hypothetical protein
MFARIRHKIGIMRNWKLARHIKSIDIVLLTGLLVMGGIHHGDWWRTGFLYRGSMLIQCAALAEVESLLKNH